MMQGEKYQLESVEKSSLTCEEEILTRPGLQRFTLVSIHQYIVKNLCLIRTHLNIQVTGSDSSTSQPILGAIKWPICGKILPVTG